MSRQYIIEMERPLRNMDGKESRTFLVNTCTDKFTILTREGEWHKSGSMAWSDTYATLLAIGYVVTRKEDM